MRFWLSILLCLSCTTTSCRVGNPPSCITQCGVLVFNALHPCDEYQFAEDVTLREFQFVTDARLHTCTLKGWHVEVQPSENFKGVYGAEVSGQTLCEADTMYVNNRLPNQSSLSHELAHALQACEPKGTIDPTDRYHSGWITQGIYDAISRIRSAK